MSLSYGLGPYIFHIPVGVAYVAVKVGKYGLPGECLELFGPQLRPQLAHEPLKLKGPLHKQSAF